MLFTHKKLLGETLKQAGLISDLQIQIVLEERKYNDQLRVGEIMALRGWINQKTADFFAEEWHTLINQSQKYPLGYYLEKSGLLTKNQVELILEEQQKIWVKFGSVAVLQGVLAKETVDFFLGHLFPLELLDSPLIGKKTRETINRVPKQTNLEIEPLEEEYEVKKDLDYDDIPWID